MTLALDPAKAVLQLRRDGAALLETARRDIDAVVPPCPGWRVRDVLLHTGEVYAHKVAAMRSGVMARPESWERPTADTDPLEWYERQLAEVVAALRSASPDTPTWTWYEPDRTYGFWCRRMAQETVVHRADVELAFGDPHHVDALVAVDGVDELLERFLAYGSRLWGVGGGEPGTVAVTTSGAAWRVTMGGDAVVVSGDGGPADVTVAGTPSRLLYYLYGRLPVDVVDVRGDAGVLGRMRDLVVLVTQ